MFHAQPPGMLQHGHLVPPIGVIEIQNEMTLRVVPDGNSEA